MSAFIWVCHKTYWDEDDWDLVHMKEPPTKTAQWLPVPDQAVLEDWEEPRTEYCWAIPYESWEQLALLIGGQDFHLWRMPNGDYSLTIDLPYNAETRDSYAPLTD